MSRSISLAGGFVDLHRLAFPLCPPSAGVFGLPVRSGRQVLVGYIFIIIVSERSGFGVVELLMGH